MPTAFQGFAIVDDTPMLAELVGHMLSSAGYKNIKTFDDPKEALDEIISNGNISMVITDYNMPGMTGSELLSAVYEYNSHIKGLIMSAEVGLVKGEFNVLEKGKNFQSKLIQYLDQLKQ